MKKGIYQHFKGNYYIVMGTATHTETKETLVLYHSKENPEQTWARPLEMFNEEVQTEKGLVKRFEFISD